MPLSFEYRPPAIDARVVVAAAAEAGVEAGGKVLLDSSVANCPKDTGALADSGQVTKVAPGVIAVSFGQHDGAGRDGRDTADYAVPVHEHLDDNHPNGGIAKFEEVAMHSDAAAILAAMAEPLRAVL